MQEKRNQTVFEIQKKITGYNVLKEYYAKYLTDVRGLSKSSVNHYFDALNNISRCLKEKGLVKKDIYEIQNLVELERVRDVLYADVEFIKLNQRGRRMYSAGLNNYCRFASGAGFQEAKDKILLLDIPVDSEMAVTVEQKIWKRSNIIRTQTIECAGYSCEIDKKHETFIAEKTQKPYMESHHAIPMKLQPKFAKSLDVYANVVCLCPICHRRIHYGIKKEKKVMLDAIYTKRADRLANSGIRISKEEFKNLVVNL